jgi:hypothetical protein
MAKKQAAPDSSADLNEQQEKQQKKLAKQEAKAMLVIDEAREKLAAAEKKLAKAQLRLEMRRTRLQTAEARLADQRNSHQPAGIPEAAGYSEATGETAEIAASANGEGGSEESASSGEETAGADESEADTHSSQVAGAAASVSAASAAVDARPEEMLSGVESQADATTVMMATVTAGEASAALSEAGGDSEQAQQVPWWQRAQHNQGQHEG